MRSQAVAHFPLLFMGVIVEPWGVTRVVATLIHACSPPFASPGL